MSEFSVIKFVGDEKYHNNTEKDRTAYIPDNDSP